MSAIAMLPPAPSTPLGVTLFALLRTVLPARVRSQVPRKRMSESELIVRAMQGDLTAWRGLHGLYYERLWYETLHRGVPSDHASDVLQTAFAKAVHNVGQFEGTPVEDGQVKGLYTWIRRIVHNACIDWHRRRQSRGAADVQVLSLVDEQGNNMVENLADEEQPSPDQGVDRARLGRALLIAICSLGTDQRTIVEQHLVAGRPLPEVAREQGVAIGTAKSRLRLARKALRTHAALQPFGGPF
ncbi:MAG: RNA polymerase sigma-70 factor (ECF subfamily) [Kiritimatiellia bacterium]|jgi:RNA polymerase sigma-70 factor (ECF subfamily)